MVQQAALFEGQQEEQQVVEVQPALQARQEVLEAAEQGVF